MKQLAKKALSILSHITHVLVYCIIFIVLAVTSFALYVKINTLDISFLISYLKQENVINEATTVEKLHLEFEDSFSVIAKNVNVKTKTVNLNVKKANVEISKASLLRAKIAAKHIQITNANINLNADTVIANTTPTTEKPNYHAAIKQISEIAKWTKSLNIDNSNIDVTYNGENQELKDINLHFFKAKSKLTFAAQGVYKLNNNNSPVTAAVHINNTTDNIDLEISVDNLESEDLFKTFVPSDEFNVHGNGIIIIHASLDKENQLKNIAGSSSLKNGFISIPSLYDNNLPFKEINTNFNYDIKNKLISINKTTLNDKNNNFFNIFGDFSFKGEPTLNITAKTATIDLLDAFTYIPDLEFTKWLDQHIYKGDASNVKFGFYGPLRADLDGVDDNPYFDITADFENVALTYLEDIPAVENAKGKFNLFKKNIDINVETATHSKQNIERASVNISPLFEEATPLITIKALSNGSVEDVIDVLDNKLEIPKSQAELLQQYTGLQETQSTITLYLDRLDELDTYNPQKESFIKLNVRSDISEITGIDPAFNQRFQATDAIVKITEEDFTLEASGFMDENPFSIVLQEKLLNFGEHTKLKANSNFDSFLIKEYLDIPSFNLSGIVYSEIELAKKGDTWNFDLNANLDDSLVNFGLLNYTKPFSKKGMVSAIGSFDEVKNILTLTKSNINIDDAKAQGSAKIILNNLPASTAELKNIVIKDKTNLDEFSLKSNMLTIKGKKLDIRPFTMAKKMQSNDDSQVEEASINKPQTIKKFNIKLDKLYLDDDSGIIDVTMLLNASKTLTGLIKAREAATSQNIYMRLTEDKENKNIVNVESLIPDIGNYFRKSDIYDNMNNGHGILFGTLTFENNKFDYADLQFNIKRFQLLRAPLLAQALAIISLEQLLSKKDGILFDDFYTKIHYEDSIVKFKDGKLKGPSLGILLNGAYDLKTKTTDMNGTLVPVVKLNSVVSNIPLLGYILTGSQGAITGADFKIYGSEGKQNVSVSPLSILTPGIVKDLFESVSSIGTNPNESKAINKARKKANIESKPKIEEK